MSDDPTSDERTAEALERIADCQESMVEMLGSYFQFLINTERAKQPKKKGRTVECELFKDADDIG
jgi:hypothetical protein